MKKYNGLTLALTGLAFTSTATVAAPIVHTSSFITQSTFEHNGTPKRYNHLQRHLELTDEDYISTFDTQGGMFDYSNIWEYYEANAITPNQWTTVNAKDGSIKAYSQSTNPAEDYVNMGHPASLKVTEVASVLGFRNLELDVFADETITIFDWNIDGILKGLAGYGAAIEVTLTNTETGDVHNSLVTTMDTTVNKQVGYFNYDHSTMEIYAEDRLTSEFNLAAGNYALDVDLGFTAVTVSGHTNTFSYVFNGDVYDIIDDEKWRYSNESTADLSHTATFGISSPTMQNLSLQTGNFSQLLTPQIEEIIMAGGGPDSVNAPSTEDNTSGETDYADVVSVPEPSSLGLLAAGLVALRLRRR